MKSLLIRLNAIESNLKQRVITAAIGAFILLLLLIVGDRFGAQLIASVLSLGMIYEFVTMTFSLSDLKEKRIILMGTSWIMGFLNFWLIRSEFELLIFASLSLGIYFLMTAETHSQNLKSHFNEWVLSVFTLFFFALFPQYLVSIRGSAWGLQWTLLYLLIVWGGDTGAYFVGKKYGTKKLYPLMSPSKTVEGALGGFLTGIILSLLFKFIFFKQLGIFSCIFTAAIIGIVAPTGDLIESFLKRAYGQKDSGNLLPGHGGFLDRFDSVLLSLPVMYACVRIFG
jgi:phosphatidate cytidylyltransferase